MRKDFTIVYFLITVFIIHSGMLIFTGVNDIKINSTKNLQKIINISPYASDKGQLFNKEIVMKEYREKKFSNAERCLMTPTYDFSGEAVHPKVLYIEDGWNGYRYWMGITPYPKGDDDFENPQILVSNDGKHFKMINIAFAPIVRPLDVASGGHYSDICLCLVNNVMELYFRYNPSKVNGVGTNNSINIIYRMTSKDGINWTQKQLIMDGNTFGENYNYVSPAIVYVGGVYKVWFSQYNGDIYHTETRDWTNFREPILCSFKDKPKELKTWHQDIIYTDEGYEMITDAYNDPNFYPHNLYYSLSDDGIHFGALKEVLKVSKSNQAFDNKSLYKSSLVKVGDEYKLYYSACDLRGHWHIGLAEKK